MTKLLIILYIIGAATLGLIIFSGTLVNWFRPELTQVVENLPTPSPTQKLTPTPIPIETLRNKSVINDNVPFVLQAPLGEWNDPRQQDACEEASALMAVNWALGKTLGSPQEIKDEILQIADSQTATHGDSRDTSAKDTLQRIINGYFNYHNAKLVENVSADDIIRELHNGNLVITPMNGQTLNNPYFTQPGPERHMVLIIGYDANTNEFITNDPGIGVGKNYRYPVGVFENSIRDYATGYHLPIPGGKNMIVIRK